MNDIGNDINAAYEDGFKDGYKAKDDEVIRCKDCRYWNNFSSGHCMLHDIRPTPLIMVDWYCADGKRRK